MPLWTFPGVVTGPVVGPLFAAELDLGCRLFQPIVIHLAGINPRRGGSTEAKLQEMLPEGTRFVALAQRITGDELRAHICLRAGGDIVSTLRHRADPQLRADYGGGFDKVWRYPATVVRAEDGDTTKARLDMGVPTRYVNAVRVRHVNSAEHRTVQGDSDAAYATAELSPGLPITVTSHSLEKYGRVLGDITLPDGSDYASLLLAAGHAVPYEGGAR